MQRLQLASVEAVRAAEVSGGGSAAAQLYQAVTSGSLDSGALLNDVAAAVGLRPLQPLDEMPPLPPPMPPPADRLERSSSCSPRGVRAQLTATHAAAAALEGLRGGPASAGRPPRPPSVLAGRPPRPPASPPAGGTLPPLGAGVGTPTQPVPASGAGLAGARRRSKRSLDDMLRGVDSKPQPALQLASLERPPLQPMQRTHSVSALAEGPALPSLRLGRAGSLHARSGSRAPSPQLTARPIQRPVMPHAEAAVRARQLAQELPLEAGLSARAEAVVRLQAADSGGLTWRMHFLLCPVDMTVGSVAQVASLLLRGVASASGLLPACGATDTCPSQTAPRLQAVAWGLGQQYSLHPGLLRVNMLLPGLEQPAGAAGQPRSGAGVAVRLWGLEPLLRIRWGRALVWESEILSWGLCIDLREKPSNIASLDPDSPAAAGTCWRCWRTQSETCFWSTRLSLQCLPWPWLQPQRWRSSSSSRRSRRRRRQSSSRSSWGWRRSCSSRLQCC